MLYKKKYNQYIILNCSYQFSKKTINFFYQNIYPFTHTNPFFCLTGILFFYFDIPKIVQLFVITDTPSPYNRDISTENAGAFAINVIPLSSNP